MNRRLQKFCFMFWLFSFVLCSSAITVIAEDLPQKELWLQKFQFVPVESGEAVPKNISAVSEIYFSVKVDLPVRQLVRISVPFPYGFMKPTGKVYLNSQGTEILADCRVLTTYGGSEKYIRRAMLSYVDEFKGSEKQYTVVRKEYEESPQKSDGQPLQIGGNTFNFDGSKIIVEKDGTDKLIFSMLSPQSNTSAQETKEEIIERGEHYLWVRWLQWDEQFPKIVELRASSTGQFAIRVLLQRWAKEDGYAPEFGIGIEGDGSLSNTIEGSNTQVENTWTYDLNTGKEISFLADNRKICFPDAAAWRKGVISGEKTDTGWKIVYLRSRDIDKVPHQPMAWRMANVYVSPSELPVWNELLEPPVIPDFPVSLCRAVYDFNECPEPENEVLREVVRWHRNAMAITRLYGDDFGNISTMPQNAVFGMNRLNHNTEIFYEYLRTCNEGIRKTFMLWCQNYAQLSVWWGDLDKSTFGGTRYNNITANNPKLHADDKTFMWRSNDSVTFCTKGIENFLLAYEETGDPFYSSTLNAQVAYAKEHVHANTGECRNIGAVKDFMLLYKALGKVEYAEKALRLFQELREKLSEDNLFSQGGEPLQKELPFIDDDRTGYNNPFPKPYILGYALQGLPDLYMEYPNEPRLYETIEAVAKYMAETVDPAGGWRYPHPRSTWIIISQGIEHAHQIANACKVMNGKSPYLELCLDAIETVLQARIAGLTLNQCVLSSLGAWEYATGKVEAGKNLGEIYKKFDERDYTRDYTEGQISCGDYVSPEGVVYFSSVLNYYLQHRNAFNVLSPKKAELRTLLQRLQQHPEQPPKSQDRDCSIEKGLPKFTSQFLSNYVPALRYDPGKFPDFGAWKKEGQRKVFETLGYPPPFTFFNPEWICEEDRGSYTAKKLKINISEWERIPAYLLIPKGTPPFPAVICLHDHGAHFSIGKEKVVRPIVESEEVMKDALDWVGQCYEGRFVGDELATRGYVVLAIDALFWGARQECEGSKYENQQQLGSNIFHLGTSWLGIITWDDIRSAEFLASLPEVDSDHIGAVGLSMGAHRTWMLSALSDNVKVGCAICWLATTPTLIVPDNNQTRGQSAYSMLSPNLYQYLDIPDVAGLACPKPMLFFNGSKDSLFPIEGVEEAYKIMHKVWDTQNKSENLCTKIWDEPHVFNKTMQEEAFAWLDKHLKTK